MAAGPGAADQCLANTPALATHRKAGLEYPASRRWDTGVLGRRHLRELRPERAQKCHGGCRVPRLRPINRWRRVPDPGDGQSVPGRAQALETALDQCAGAYAALIASAAYGVASPANPSGAAVTRPLDLGVRARKKPFLVVTTATGCCCELSPNGDTSGHHHT